MPKNAVFSELKVSTIQRLQRWALALLNYNYVIEHVAGDDNKFADLLSRFGFMNRSVSIKRVSTNSIRPLADDDFTWPTLDEISRSQQLVITSTPRDDLTLADGIWLYRNRVWIPETDELLQTRLLVIAHCGTLQGHRGSRSTLRKLQSFCAWKYMAKSSDTFCRTCLLCLQVKGGKTIPRPFGRTLQAETPSQVLHYDYIHIGPAFNDQSYVLVLKDGLTNYCELIATVVPDGAVSLQALLDWGKRFRYPEYLVSDSASHFKNRLIADACTRLQINDYFTLAYCPWSNPAERINRDLIAVLKALLHDLHYHFDLWPLVLPLVQHALNHSPLESLGGLAPVTVFAGFEPDNPLEVIFNPRRSETVPVPPTTDAILERYEALRLSLADMHRTIIVEKEKQRTRNTKNQNKLDVARFQIGDYVLWSTIDLKAKRHESKLMVTWKGPFRVVDTRSEWVFTIEHLLTHKKHDAHSTRLKFYHDQSLDVTDELKQHVSEQGMEYEISQFKGIRFNNMMNRYEILVSWMGFEECESSWEPFTTLWDGTYFLLTEFFKSLSGSDRNVLQKLCRKHKKLILEKAKKIKTLEVDELPL